MQAKVEHAWEADPPETAVHSVSPLLQRQKAAQAKEQARLTELEEAAKKAAESVEEAKQKAIKRQEEVDRLQAEYDQELARLVQTKETVTQLQKSLRDAFQTLSGCVEAQPSFHSWKQLSQAFRACWRLQRPRRRPPMRATTSMCSRTRTGPFRPMRGLRTLGGGAPRGRARGQEAEVYGVRRRRAQGLATSSATSTRPTALAAGRLLPARDHSFHPLQRFWLEKDFPLVSLIKKQPGQLPRRTSQRGNLDS